VRRNGRRVTALVGSVLLIAALSAFFMASRLAQSAHIQRTAVEQIVPDPLESSKPTRATLKVTTPPSAPKPIVKPILPSQLFVPAIGVNSPILAKPTTTCWDAQIGRTVQCFPVPSNATSVVWWQSGPLPGTSRMAIMLGHHEIGGYGVFNNLGSLRLGQEIMIEGQGTVLHFIVIGSHSGIPKSSATALDAVLQKAPSGSRLALITCSGEVNSALNSHEDNTVVFAKLASATPS
jgi:sortase family protein